MSILPGGISLARETMDSLQFIVRSTSFQL